MAVLLLYLPMLFSQCFIQQYRAGGAMENQALFRTFYKRPAVLLWLGCSPFLTAQAEPLNLAQQVVTATRTATPLVSVASSSVITREDIERSQAQSVPDMLRGLAGVQIVSNGGRGKSTSLYLRGTSEKQLLVLIDGVKVGSATSGAAALQDIPLALVERIEVVRGPRSSLYGSEALGGVIQIFTRRGAKQGLKPYLALGTGTRSSSSANAGLAGGSQNGWFDLGVSSEDTDGINARAYRPSAAGAYEPDADGYRQLAGSLRGGYRFVNGLELDGSWMQSSIHSDQDLRSSSGKTGRYSYADGEQQVLGGRARFTPLEPWDVTLQAGHSEDRTDNFRDGGFYSRFDTERYTFAWQNDFSLTPEQLLSLGFDYQQDRIDTSDTYAEDSRDNRGYYTQYQGRFGRHGVSVGLRRDDNQQFGEHDTGNLGWSYELSERLTLSAAYGTAFRAPTFNDLYTPNSGSTAGNPDLKPEKSENYELGLQGGAGWGEWRLSVFENQIDDLIVWAGSKPMRPQNVESARIRGLESSVRTQLENWDLAATLTLLDPQDRSQENHGHQLARRAKRTFNIDADRRIGSFGVGATLFAASQRFNDASNTEDSRLPGYALVDLRGEYHIDSEWRLQAKVSNLFDRDYETAQTYEQPGRAFYLTLRYQAL
ncbi:TonB-dependent vitamin B12 receptor [Pseudomonas sp. MIL19]|uniref:TonB-dependent vitamin B12 receptor n=2 Tax=Pseudomonas TaxID=286 RepID=A0ABU5PED4_9PSED|nr:MULTISPECIES: TonB-dependent vitamin B12 receptor [unclassified Pseudomonas]MDD2161601.1 TonB-dependent vitamin B12 receptor [Pseudomonas sp. MIL19]MEA1608000.1 TonB-dependent vitamin B12 receptor [Pseudomonas sp. T5W1]